MALKRLFRFRLRTMLGLVLAASLFCAYVSNYLLTLDNNKVPVDNNKVPGAKNEIDAVKTEVKTPE